MKKIPFTLAILMAFTSQAFALSSSLEVDGEKLDFNFYNIALEGSSLGCKAFENANNWIRLALADDEVYLNPSDLEEKYMPYSSDIVQVALSALYSLSDLQSEEGGIYCTCLKTQSREGISACEISKESSALTLGGIAYLGQTLLDEWNYEPNLTEDQRKQILFNLCKIKMMLMGGELSTGMKTKGLFSYFISDKQAQEKADIFYFSSKKIEEQDALGFVASFFDSSDDEEIVLTGEAVDLDDESSIEDNEEFKSESFLLVIDPKEMEGIKHNAALGPLQIKILEEGDISDLMLILPKSIEDWLIQDETSFFLNENKEPHEKALFKEKQGILGPFKGVDDEGESEIANLLPATLEVKADNEFSAGNSDVEPDEPALYQKNTGILGPSNSESAEESEITNLLPVDLTDSIPKPENDEGFTTEDQSDQKDEGVLYDQNSGLLGPVKSPDDTNEEEGLVPNETISAGDNKETQNEGSEIDENPEKEGEDSSYEGRDWQAWFRSLFTS